MTDGAFTDDQSRETPVTSEAMNSHGGCGIMMGARLISTIPESLEFWGFRSARFRPVRRSVPNPEAFEHAIYKRVLTSDV